MFIFSAGNFHSRRTQNENLAPENGIDLWRQFLKRVSWALASCLNSSRSLVVWSSTSTMACEWSSCCWRKG